MTDPRLARPSWRGRTNVDALTISVIERAEAIVRDHRPDIAHDFYITQGSYQSSVAASAGTHDRGGAVDIRWCGHPFCVWALRAAGAAGTWHRKASQGPWPDHIHAVVYGHPDLAPSAARQIDAVLAGRNGLANNGPDDGPRFDPFPKAAWPPIDEGLDMDENKLRQIIREELADAIGDLDDVKIDNPIEGQKVRRAPLGRILFAIRASVQRTEGRVKAIEDQLKGRAK